MTKTQELILALKSKGVSKWKISKVCVVSWQTVHNWDRGMFEPKAEKAKLLKGLLDNKIYLLE